MNTYETRQGSHSIRELLDWSKTVRILRFFPGSGQGMGYTGEYLGVSLLPTAEPPSLLTESAISDKLKPILEKEFPQFKIGFTSSDSPNDIRFHAFNGREQDAHLEEQDFDAAPSLEKRLEELSVELGLKVLVSSNAMTLAFNPDDYG
jgi:hypothetical protein